MTDRCPTCGHKVQSIFDHLDIECEHDMTEAEIKHLLAVDDAFHILEPEPKLSPMVQAQRSKKSRQKDIPCPGCNRLFASKFSLAQHRAMKSH